MPKNTKNQINKRVAYIHTRYRAFVDRPELINRLLEIAMKDAVTYLGEDTTLASYLDNHAEITKQKEDALRKQVHQEDLDFIKALLQIDSGLGFKKSDKESTDKDASQNVQKESSSSDSTDKTTKIDSSVEESKNNKTIPAAKKDEPAKAVDEDDENVDDQNGDDYVEEVIQGFFKKINPNNN